MKSFSHNELRRMLIGAYLQVYEQRESINKVNLFPVPDKDTGINLVRTLRGVYDVIIAGEFRDADHLRREVLEQALINAAGNAGIIVTSFLEGFLTSCSDNTTGSVLVSAFAVGSEHAFASVQQPKTGTILDVMRETAQGLQMLDVSDDPMSILRSAHTLAKTALSKTKTTSAASFGKKVVDAGGLGFVSILEGFIRGITQDSVSAVIPPTHEVSAKSLISLQEKQHEVVALLRNVRKTRGEVLNTLAQHGDSIDIVELYGKMKIHIHTDFPDTVRTLIAEFGTLLESKTVNMNEGEKPQYTKDERSIGIVVDEGASLVHSYVQQHGICVVPFQFQWDTHPTIPLTSLYKTMRSVDRDDPSLTLPRTSQPSPHAFLQAFNRELRVHDSVVCILTSSQVSGTYNSALHARSQLPPTDRKRVYIPDFRQALAGQSLLVQFAVRILQQRLEIQDVVDALVKKAQSINVFGFGSDTFWLVKGGRMSKTRSVFANLLLRTGIQPVIGLKDGKLSATGLTWRRKSLADMAYSYMKDTYPVGSTKYDVVLHDSDIPDEVSKLRELLHGGQFDVVDSGPISPIAGIHIGPGALIVGMTPKIVVQP